jgi:guanylate kinase
MIGRAQDNAAEIAGRMQTAERELQEAHKFDFIIESRTREEDFATLLSILEQARTRAAAGAA